MIVFETKEKEKNTLISLNLALEKAKSLDTDIVVATTAGKTAETLIELANEQKFKGKIIAVTHAYGSIKAGKNVLDETLKKVLSDKGVIFVTAAHVLSGAERGLSKKHQGVSPVEIMADTLRLLSQGVKVCVEIGVMAMDAGAIEYNKPIIAIGGDGRGANTVVSITPSYASTILETRIHEIYCKPY